MVSAFLSWVLYRKMSSFQDKSCFCIPMSFGINAHAVFVCLFSCVLSSRKKECMRQCSDCTAMVRRRIVMLLLGGHTSGGALEVIP
jgi:hypothetical protein